MPGLTPHSSVATSGEMTVTSGMPRSNFGGFPTENNMIKVDGWMHCFAGNVVLEIINVSLMPAAPHHVAYYLFSIYLLTPFLLLLCLDNNNNNNNDGIIILYKKMYSPVVDLNNK